MHVFSTDDFDLMHGALKAAGLPAPDAFDWQAWEHLARMVERDPGKLIDAADVLQNAHEHDEETLNAAVKSAVWPEEIARWALAWVERERWRRGLVTKADRADVQHKRKLTPKQLAESLGCSSEKVIGWIKSGELKAANVAKNRSGKKARYLIDAGEVEAFERRRAAGDGPAPQRKRRADPPGLVRYYS